MLFMCMPGTGNNGDVYAFAISSVVCIAGMRHSLQRCVGDAREAHNIRQRILLQDNCGSDCEGAAGQQPKKERHIRGVESLLEERESLVSSLAGGDVLIALCALLASPWAIKTAPSKSTEQLSVRWNAIQASCTAERWSVFFGRV